MKTYLLLNVMKRMNFMEAVKEEEQQFQPFALYYLYESHLDAKITCKTASVKEVKIKEEERQSNKEKNYIHFAHEFSIYHKTTLLLKTVTFLGKH